MKTCVSLYKDICNINTRTQSPKPEPSAESARRLTSEINEFLVLDMHAPYIRYKAFKKRESTLKFQGLFPDYGVFGDLNLNPKPQTPNCLSNALNTNP